MTAGVLPDSGKPSLLRGDEQQDQASSFLAWGRWAQEAGPLLPRASPSEVAFAEALLCWGPGLGRVTVTLEGEGRRPDPGVVASEREV